MVSKQEWGSADMLEENMEGKRVATCKEKFMKGLMENMFTILTLIGVAVGFGIGFGVGTLRPSTVTITWIKLIGDLYINLLQLTILPIIAANIIVVMARMDPKQNGKMSLAAICFVIGFDLISGAIGVITAALIKPGLLTTANAETTSSEGPDSAPVTTSDVFVDLIKNMFPDNIVGLTIHQTKTIRRWPYYPSKNVTVPVTISLDATNMIGLIFTTIMFGIAAGAAGKAGKVFVDFFDSLGNVVLIMMRWFLKATPVGVCFMVAGSVVGLENVSDTFKSLGLFMVTVLAALAIHMLLQMIVYLSVSSRNPFRMLVVGFRVFFLSFITTSPLVAIPEMMEACDKYGIKKKVSQFVIPFSAALKGDGSGVFQAVACVFIAQLTGFELTGGTYVLIALLTGFATLAIPMVPSSSIIIVITILSSLGANTAEVSLLFAVEWIMDRCRSGSIGYGHLYAAAFTHSVAIGRRTEGEDIVEKMEKRIEYESDDGVLRDSERM
nr:hypothetical transcript [Hymenolepis microstoma]